MLIVILVIIGLSILILGHEAGHFFVAKFFGLKVDEFGFGFPPRIFAWRPKGKNKKNQPFDVARGETEYSLNWLLFGGFVRIAGENDGMDKDEQKLEDLPEKEKRHLFLFQPAWRKALVIVAGVAINFLIGWFLLSLVLLIGTPRVLVISGIQQNSPAEKVGILSGDILKNFPDADGFIKFVNVHRGQEVVLNIVRDGKDTAFTVVPRIETAPSEGALGVFLSEAGEERVGFFAAIWSGLKRALIICWLTLAAFYQLVKNLLLHGSLLQGVVGPIGIFSVAEESGRIGLIYLVQLISMISLNLAVVNLIPFPALDGGRLFLIFVEKVKGSPISKKTEGLINGLGFAFLIFLMVMLTIRDIGRLF